MTDLIILLAGIAISWLVFNVLIKIVKTGVNTAFVIAIFVLLLQIVFGVSPKQVWQEIMTLAETIKEFFVK